LRWNAWADRTLAAVAACGLEAAWVYLLYVVVASLATAGEPPLSIATFGLAALAGLVFGRWASQRRLASYGAIAAAIAVVAALVGWLGPLGFPVPEVLRDPMGLLQQHPGGLLVGLAFLRGTAHITPGDDERIAETALGIGLAAVSGTWILLTASGATRDGWVMEAAFVSTLTFVAAALLSIGLARLADVDDPSAVGADRRTRRVLFIVLSGLFVVAIPLSVLLGVSMDEAVRDVLGPVADALLAIATILLLPAALLAALLVSAFDALVGHHPLGQPAPLPDQGTLADELRKLIGAPAQSIPALGLIPLVAAIVVAVVLGRAFLERPRRVERQRNFTEVRGRERPASVALPRLRVAVPRRRAAPRTASEAYLASLDVVKGTEGLARDRAETPAEHAARLPPDERGAALRRLASDYALAEFGERTISPTEHHRAIERWRRLRATAHR
jgi:hypothetical protein